MARPRLLALLLFSACLVSACGSSGIGDILPVTVYGATLSGANEVPPVTSLATGTVVMTYNDVTDLFDIEVTISGMAAADVIGWHIHVGPAGTNGPIIVNFTSLGGTFIDIGGGTIRATGGAIAFPPAFKSELDAGGCYLNIHTNAAPAGEVRGQLSDVL